MVTVPRSIASAAHSKWLRRVAWAVAGIVVLWALAWALVPPLLRSQAQQRLSQALGRPVTIAAVEFQPWSLQLAMTDVTVGAAADAGPNAPPLLQVARVHANGDWRSAIRFAPVLSRLQIDAPRLHVARTAAGRYDIDDVIQRLSSRPSDAPPPQDKGPVRFALYDLELRDGRIVFDDRPVQRRHEVTALQLSLPLLSSLAPHVDVVVQPRLSFRLGDTHFDTGAQTTPFAPDRQTQMTLRMSELDVAPLAAYLPADLPVKLQRGRLKAEMTLRYERLDGGAQALSLQGAAEASDVALADRAGAPLAAWKALRLEVADARPLERNLALGTVRVDGLQLAVARDGQGAVNLARLQGEPSKAPAAKPAPAGTPWQFSLQALELAGARVTWADAATEPATALSLEAIDARLGPAAWPSTKPAPLTLAAQLRGPGSGVPATLQVEGSADATQATVKLRAAGLALPLFEPYLRAALQPRLDGTALVEGTVAWAAEPQALTLDVARLALEDLRVIDGNTTRASGEAAAKDGRTRGGAPRDPLTWKALELADTKVDFVARSASLGRVALKQPRLTLERASDGTLNVARWTVPGEPSQTQAGPAPAAPPWRVTFGETSIEDGRVRWLDHTATASLPLPLAGEGGGEGAASRVPPSVRCERPALTPTLSRKREREPTSPCAPPVRLNISALNATATGLTWPAAASPADLRLAAVVSDPAAPRGSRRQQGGTVDWRGRIALEPLAMAGALRVERFPLHALEPYFGGGFHASVQRAEGAWHGDVALRRRANGIEASASGDALVAELHVFGVDPDDGAVSQDELLSWRSLQVRGLKVDVAPDVRPRVDVGEAVVSDFYSQLVVTEEGRFNLRDVRAPQPGTASPPGGFAVGRQIAPQPTPAASAPAPAASAPATAASAPTTPQDGLPIDLRVGGLQLVNGRIDYTDRFVRPNYSAALSELNGRLGAFEAGSREMATLELDGRVAGTAQLEIRGSLNPTADPLALDVRAKASDLELAPLSPYAGKYAGYAIERGKLSMDVHYRVQPDGRLEASNRVVLNQLTFGERIESPDATKLPVRLAVALLKDRNGVIDVNLPVSGSINDPQFSVAGVVVRIIGNLIAKALTSPFSLLAGGGGEDLSVVAFRPGTAALADDAGSVIDKVAKALQDRPALQMTVTGSADPAAEADAIRRASLERRVAAQRRNDAVRAGRAAAADVPMTPEERERVLRAVYRDTELPDKPRNVLGLEKDLSAAEMEALLLKHQPASPDAARELALQRGVAVRDALVAKGLPSERLFLAAPKLGSGDEGAPQAKLALSLK